MRNHKNLKAFELADEVVFIIYKATSGFPREEIFGLTSQVRRAAVSIVSNIVEGCARESQREYARFLEMSYGSLKEVQYQISLAMRLEYMSAKQAEELITKMTSTEKVLSSLYLKMRLPS
jgi:four helix bundle protein